MARATAAPTPKAPTLEEIDEQWRAFERAVDAAEGSLTPEMEAQLEVLQLTTKAKVDGYVFRIRDLESRIKRDKQIEHEVASRRRGFDAEIDWLKARVGAVMDRQGREELLGEVYRFQWEQNGGVAPVELTVASASPAFPARFLKPPPPPPPVQVDTDALRTALEAKDPEAMAVARLTRGRHVMVR